MKAEQEREQVDYEEDVDNLKRVWAQIKEPNKKTAKATMAKTPTAIQTKVSQEQKSKPSKEKKNKIVVS